MAEPGPLSSAFAMSEAQERVHAAERALAAIPASGFVQREQAWRAVVDAKLALLALAVDDLVARVTQLEVKGRRL